MLVDVISAPEKKTYISFKMEDTLANMDYEEYNFDWPLCIWYWQTFGLFYKCTKIM